MDDFPMCDDCKDEYTNPTNRRFHSQTNTCSTCGIHLVLINTEGETIETSKNDIFKNVANLLSEGNIVAIKNTSGYLLFCNAENETVVKKLREKKSRPNKPFAVLFPSLDFLQNDINLTTKETTSLTSAERPITIISSKNYKGKIALNLVLRQTLHYLHPMVVATLVLMNFFQLPKTVCLLELQLKVMFMVVFVTISFNLIVYKI